MHIGPVICFAALNYRSQTKKHRDKEKKQNENNDCDLCIFQKLIPSNDDSYNFTAILKTISNF